MDAIPKNRKPVTPVKENPRSVQCKSQESSRLSENSNPNLPSSRSPKNPKPEKSPLTKSAKAQKSGSKIATLNQPIVAYSPRNKIRERKFVVAKKKNSRKEEGAGSVSSNVDCNCKEKFGGNAKKCVCMAYKKLRASQEEFFKTGNGGEGEAGWNDAENMFDAGNVIDLENEEMEKGFMPQKIEIEDGYEPDCVKSGEVKAGQMGVCISPTIKRRRDKLMEEARNSVPECGKVMHLVKAFEKLSTIPKEAITIDENEEIQDGDHKKAAMQWALPGLQAPEVLEHQDSSASASLLPEFQPPKLSEMQGSSFSFCPSDFILTSDNLGLDSRFSVSSSWDGSQGSVSRRSSNGGRRSRRNSSDSVGMMNGRRWKKKQQLKVTCQKPFKLRTEQRGRMKEEEFAKKVQEMMIVEERQRIPTAQGLPWTTDEPECLIKPPVKENTVPLDLKLHTDTRAEERADFDQQVAEKMSLIEQYKMERERQQKLAEEEEIHRLRKELIPKAQPMPYFDRPFIPKRSMKQPTIPREPKFHIPQSKKIKSCLSWNDMSPYSYHD